MAGLDRQSTRFDGSNAARSPPSAPTAEMVSRHVRVDGRDDPRIKSGDGHDGEAVAWEFALAAPRLLEMVTNIRGSAGRIIYPLAGMFGCEDFRFRKP